MHSFKVPRHSYFMKITNTEHKTARSHTKRTSHTLYSSNIGSIQKLFQVSLLVTVTYCCRSRVLSGAEETSPNWRMSQCIPCIHKDSLKHFVAHFQCSPYRHLFCSLRHTFQEYYLQWQQGYDRTVQYRLFLGCLGDS